MFVDKLSKKEKIGLSIACILVLTAIFDRAVCVPIRNRMQKLNQEVSLSEKELARYLYNLEQEKTVTKEYGDYIQYVKEAGSDEEETAKALGEIETLARKSGLCMVDIKPYAPKATGFYKEYIFEIEAETDMESLISFLHQLDSSPQLLCVEKLRLSLKETGGSAIKASIVITKQTIF
ncbi:MAG: type 4a pilus biogenesis protein PilO [Candidatus Omnitrophica bacterium]|nr:type 4a pilus biogenesis protein PilO [Candidatus Omnitrophota bacterium]